MFFRLKNLSAQAVERVEEPWTLGLSIPASIPDKDSYKAWATDIGTDHAFMSAYEGLSPIIRIGKDNPPVKMHGLIADYDFRTGTTDKLTELAAKPCSEWKPSHGSISFSKGAKLYWTFEKPIPISPGLQATLFLERLMKELNAKAWLPGLDVGLTAKVDQYYEVGTSFVNIGGKPIPHDMLCHWAWEATRNSVMWGEFSRYEIPMEDLAEEAQKQFPGRWTGRFTIGSRGVRFWDPAADNPTGCQVRADGMTCYTGDTPFMSWADIFGSRFVAQYAASKVKDLLENTFYDDKKFYTKIPDDEGGGYEALTKDEFGQFLRVSNFDGRLKKGATCSQIDEVERIILRKNRVKFAKKLVHFPPGLSMWEGKRYLNLGAVEPVVAAPPLGSPMCWDDGVKYFPLIHGVCNAMFNDENGDDKYHQKQYLMAWTKYFYEAGVRHEPSKGQVMILAGDPGKGKNFLSEGVIGGLMGGSTDGAPFLVDENRWTEDAAEMPLLTVSDSKASEDHRMRVAFSNNLKKIVANATMRSSQKFEKEGNVPWYGRVFVSCNLDEESLSILPTVEISNKEKVTMLKASQTKFKFPKESECRRMLQQELPFFARFLLDWEYPSFVIPDQTRFGVEHFHHPDLFEASSNQGPVGILSDYLLSFLKLDKLQAGDKRQSWSGSSIDLYSVLSEAFPQVKNEFKSVKSFQTHLGHLKTRGSIRLISAPRGRGKSSSWIIPHDNLD